MPTKTIDDIVKLAQQMIDDDADRTDELQDYDNMYRGVWSLPKELDDVDWMREVKVSDPFDAVQSGSRVLSSTTPKVKKIPLAPNEDNKKEANKQEKNLSFQLKAANRRRQTTVEQEITKNALLFSEICVMVVDLDWQLEQAKHTKQDTTRIEAARQMSRFMVNVYSPMDVHVRRSNYGVESVLLAVDRRASDVIDEWGDAAKKLGELDDINQEVTYYDYMNHTTRAVWCNIKSGDKESTTNQVVIVPPFLHELGFNPWVAIKGGEPMLYALRSTGNWDTQNIVRSIYVSTIIRNAGQPPTKEEGPTPTVTTEIDHTSGDPIRVTPNNTLSTLEPPPADAALADVDDRISAQTERTTVSRILQGGEIPSGTAFSTLNLLTQTAVGALKPAQELAERALAEVFKLMLLWVEKTEVDLYAYGTDKRSDLGEAYVIKADEIDARDIFIEVELTPDVPTDRLQRANAAGQMVQWGYPKEWALEDIGVENPYEALELWYFEREKEHVFSMAQQSELLQMQMQLEQISAQLQGVLANQQQQQDNAQLAQQQSIMMAAGQGFNPEGGGAPPMQAEPGMQTREQTQGQSFTGEGLAAPEVA